jgi:GxxExxY protein
MEGDPDGSKTKTGVKTRREDLILPDLSFRIVGCLFEVSNELGVGHLEHVFQKAVAKALQTQGIHFTQQVTVPLKFQGEQVGTYRLDFLIEDKIVLEIKQGERFKMANMKQTLAYLKSTGKPLAILANFTADGVVFKRLLNQTSMES